MLMVVDFECVDGESFVASYKSLCRHLLCRTNDNLENFVRDEASN
jgi:hypothetical protein